MDCKIISKTKPKVTSPIPSCRRGDKMTSPFPSFRRGTITAQGLAQYLSSPYRGS